MPDFKKYTTLYCLICYKDLHFILKDWLEFFGDLYTCSYIMDLLEKLPTENSLVVQWLGL